MSVDTLQLLLRSRCCLSCYKNLPPDAYPAACSRAQSETLTFGIFCPAIFILLCSPLPQCLTYKTSSFKIVLYNCCHTITISLYIAHPYQEVNPKSNYTTTCYKNGSIFSLPELNVGLQSHLHSDRREQQIQKADGTIYLLTVSVDKLEAFPSPEPKYPEIFRKN